MKLHFLLLSLCCALGWLPLSAVSLSAQSDVAMGRRNTARVNANALAASGDLKSAIGEIEMSLRRKPASAGWHAEKALYLFQLGMVAREEGRKSQAIRLGNEAMRELILAEKKSPAGDAEMRANIKNLAATVLENLSGDSELAQAVRTEAKKDRYRGDGGRIEDIITLPNDEI